LYNGCLESKQIVTHPDGSGSLRCFQILQKRYAAIVVQLDFSGEKTSKAHQWLVQPFEIWRGDSLPSDPLELDIFVLQDPQLVNILDWICPELSRRAATRHWQLCDSDLDGCLAT
jgi:hypothetical protein